MPTRNRHIERSITRAWRTAALAVLSAAIVAASFGQANAADVLRRKPAGSLSGSIKSMSPTSVTIETSGRTEEVPVNKIAAISFDGEPSALRQARTAADNGAYERVLSSLDRIDMADVKRAEVEQDIAFYRAEAMARLALSGAGDVRQAGGLMRTFVNQHADNYHALEARQLLGDLFAAVGANEAAATEYETVAEAPWPDYKMRAAIAKGKVLVAQEKYAEALAAYEQALSLAEGDDAQVEAQKLAAVLGKADCMARQGQVDEAIKTVEDVIVSLDPENVELSGQAYVTLGNCYRQKPDGAKDARNAYLHVDLIYFANREAHAEALSNLVALWNELGQPERALDASRTLKDRYANSRWAR